MTKAELFEWAAENSRTYPALGLLREASVDGEAFINLPVRYGIYKEQYYYMDKNRMEKIKHARTINEFLCGNETVEFLRSEGNAVAVIEDYETVRTLILECVKHLKNK